VDLDTGGFRLARPGTEGYEQHEVDLFVAQVTAALRHTPPTMAPWEVRDKVFKTQRVHRGYDEHDVDDFLDRAEQALRAAHGEGFLDPHEEVAARRTHPLVWAAVVLVLLAALVAGVLLVS
jgi:DivIVA domain-containing protein